MRILFVTGRFPYPPMRGDQLIPYFRTKHLAQRHEITLLSFVESQQDVENAVHLQPYCAEIHLVRLPRWRSYANMAALAPRRVPFQVSYYHSFSYRQKLKQLVATGKFDVVHAVLSRLALYTMDLRGPANICEMIDALSLSMQRRAESERGPRRWLFRQEAARMRRFEDHVCQQVDHVLVVSEADRRHLNAPNVEVLPAGVDVDPRPRPARNGQRTLIFTGNFDYYPNGDAAHFLLQEIWPALRQAVPRARLKIVGNNPRPDLLRAAGEFSDVEVTGFVPDLAEHLLQADVALSPVRLGGAGMHRKVVEALACGTPVVVSPLVSGFPVGLDSGVLVARQVSEYVSAVRTVVENPELAQSLSERARRLVAEKYSWEGTTSQLESIYLRAHARARGREVPCV